MFCNGSGFADLVSTQGCPASGAETPMGGREEEGGTRLQMKGEGAAEAKFGPVPKP